MLLKMSSFLVRFHTFLFMKTQVLVWSGFKWYSEGYPERWIIANTCHCERDDIRCFKPL